MRRYRPEAIRSASRMQSARPYGTHSVQRRRCPSSGPRAPASAGPGSRPSPDTHPHIGSPSEKEESTGTRPGDRTDTSAYGAWPNGRRQTRAHTAGRTIRATHRLHSPSVQLSGPCLSVHPEQNKPNPAGSPAGIPARSGPLPGPAPSSVPETCP